MSRTIRLDHGLLGHGSDRGTQLLRGVGALGPAVAIAVFYLFAVRAGLSVGHVLQGLLAVGLTQVLPGTLIWRAVRPRRGWWFEDLVMGLAVGGSLAVAAQTVAGLLTARWVSVFLGPAIAALMLTLPVTRRRLREARAERLPGWWGPLVGLPTLLLLEQAQAFYRVVPLSWDDGFRATYVDMPFHLSLVGQLAHRGPTEMAHVASEPLLYHWFSHAWLAQVSVSSGVPADAVLMRLAPPLITVAVVGLVAAAAVRVSGRTWAGPLGALLAVTAAMLNVVDGTETSQLLRHASPSADFSAIFVPALVLVLSVRWRNEARSGAGALVPLLALTAMGAKASALAVMMAGVGLAALASWWFRDPARKRVALDFAMVITSFVVGFLAVFAGASGRIELDPATALVQAGPSGITAAGNGLHDLPMLVGGGIFLLLAAMAPGAGVLILLADRGERHNPITHLLLGGGLAGTGAIIFLSHPGLSQFYFLRNAVPLLALASVMGIVALVNRLGRKTSLLVIWGVGSGLAAAVGTGLWSKSESASNTGSLVVVSVAWIVVAVLIGLAVLVIMQAFARRDRLFVSAGGVSMAILAMVVFPVAKASLTPSLPEATGTVEPDAAHAFSADQVAAARWLRDHSDGKDVVMTNRHCARPKTQRCDSRRFHVAGYTERQVLVEGWAYTTSNTQRAYDPFWNPGLLKLNDRFLQDPTTTGARTLADLGVKWIFVDKTAPYSESLSEFATPQFETEWSWILKFTNEQ